MPSRILPCYLLSIEPEDPLRFSITELRSILAAQLAAYTALQPTATSGWIHRYPVVQIKRVKTKLIALGLGQGAGFLHDLTRGQGSLGTGSHSCRIAFRDPVIRQERFGIAGTSAEYAFQTPWHALNQQNARKFYDLKGKPARDTFVLNLLHAQLNSLAKSLDYPLTEPLSCTAKIRFLMEQDGGERNIVFLGRFRTNLCIPDYFGIGRDVSLGHGTIKRITDPEKEYTGEP